MSRQVRERRLVLAVILATVVLYGAAFVPSGYYAFFPGGANDVSAMVQVEGGSKHSSGAFLLTTITASEANLLTYARSFFDYSITLKTRDEYLPRGMDVQEYTKYSRRLMEESQAISAVLGLRAAGFDASFSGQGVSVIEVMTDGPAHGKLLAADVIVSANEKPIKIVDDLTNFMSDTEVGDTVNLGIIRGDTRLNVSLSTVEHPTQKGRSALRIRIETKEPSYESEVKVRIESGGITGPSAGLMFALEVINQARKNKDLTYGKRIAGTGTMNPSGKVGPVGGVTQKVVAAEKARADYFFVPIDNLAEAERAARKIRVVGVETLQQAVAFLEKLQSQSRPNAVCV